MKVSAIPGLSDRDGHLCLDGIDLVKLAEQYGTPLYIGSEQRIRENIREVTSTFQTYYPNTVIHYASKAETTRATLEIVHAAGANLEVNSGGELYKGLKVGFRGEEIVFNGVAKTVRELETAIQNDLKAINVDSLFELQRIADTAEKLQKKANVVLRIVPDVASGVVKGNETGTHESKFGIMMESVEETVRFAQERSHALHLRGFHFHIGTQTFDLNSFLDSFLVLLNLCVEIHQATGFVPELLDIGGGLPIPYYIGAPASQYISPNLYQMLRGTLSVDTIARTVTAQLLREPYHTLLKDCQLVLEPGRKIVGDAFALMMRVENAKRRESLNEDWIMVDGGLNTMLEVKTYHWYFPMICANKLDEAHTRPVKIAGPLCESGDVWMDYDAHKDLPDYRDLPESITPGDYVAMLETGAYGTSQMSRYNGRPTAGILMIREDGSIQVAKTPETYENLFDGETSLFG